MQSKQSFSHCKMHRLRDDGYREGTLPYVSDVRPTTPIFKWPYLFFADQVALSVFSKTVAHATKVCEGGMHFENRVGHFLNF